MVGELYQHRSHSIWVIAGLQIKGVAKRAGTQEKRHGQSMQHGEHNYGVKLACSR